MLIDAVFKDLGLALFERGWLSSNNIVFAAAPGVPATVVDTGYGSHSGQTEALLRGQLGGQPLGRVLNTHLHSDHCGGNAALQAAWDCETWVPEASITKVAAWDETRLTFKATGQRCDRFTAQRVLRPGESVRLGAFDWEVVGAPGHDPDAVMLFQRGSAVLITADALWENRLAIIFPEVAGEPGFGEARRALDTIESLQPKILIPGHGRAFTDVATALSSSRQRIAHFEAHPEKHLKHAARAPTMFHMLEQRECGHDELLSWLAETPFFLSTQTAIEAPVLVAKMLSDGLLKWLGGRRIGLA